MVTTSPTQTSGGSSNTLADVAQFYYMTNLRPDLTPNDADGNPTYGIPKPNSSANPKIDDIAQWPHMTTFTIGMGVDGLLKYDPNYKTSGLTDTTSDFYKILCPTGVGCKNWPNAETGSAAERIDDLWHAAVNGRGTYFSVKSASALAASLKATLDSVAAAQGTGAASSTSSLNPTSGVDFGFVATYKTSAWTGELTSQKVAADGSLEPTVTWRAGVELKKKIAADGKSDTRKILTNKIGGNTLIDFKKENFTTPAEQGYFNNNQLVQYSDWTAGQKAAGTYETLINYLRGQNEYEVKTGATASLYRPRESLLGDIVHSQPVYVGVPNFKFVDESYTTFKTNLSTNFKGTGKPRPGTVYVGANDGMLHAFNAETGEERWAYVPPMVFPDLWRLADRDYAANHRYYVDGPIAVQDAEIGTAENPWVTVLVGALGGGGRGYYALDVTDPDAPKLLWTFAADTQGVASANASDNIGYTFGTATITKVSIKNSDGSTSSRWAVALPSGYNNVPVGGKYNGADGKGYVFLRNLNDGTELKTITTNVGSSASPSGLATLSAEYKSAGDHTALALYGGDLEGNMWRFSSADQSANNFTVSKLMALGSRQPITSSPEIARPSSFRPYPLIYFGTGRYLGQSDMSNTDDQYIYAVKDDGATTVTANRLALNTLSTSGSLSMGAVPINSFGWSVKLPNSGERVHLHPQLQLSAVTFMTTIPPRADAGVCDMGKGTGWVYQFSYKDGASLDGNPNVGTFFKNAPPVGLSMLGGQNLTNAGDGFMRVLAGDGSAEIVKVKSASGGGASGKATRVQWRELLK